MDSFKLPLATIGGALVILLFCIFTLASAARYPVPFSPLDNWLSDLGAATKNPQGYVYFNTGCILTGVCLLLMIQGMGSWHLEGKRSSVLFTPGRLAGTLSAFMLMLVGVFDEGTPYHLPVSIAFFFLQFVFLVLVNVSLWGHPAFDKWIGYYAAVVAFINVAFAFMFTAYKFVPVLEWLAVFSALLWVAFLACDTLKLEAGHTP